MIAGPIWTPFATMLERDITSPKCPSGISMLMPVLTFMICCGHRLTCSMVHRSKPASPGRICFGTFAVGSLTFTGRYILGPPNFQDVVRSLFTYPIERDQRSRVSLEHLEGTPERIQEILCRFATNALDRAQD